MEVYYLFGLILSIIFFNIVAFTINKTLTPKQIAHVFSFTIAFGLSFDVFIDFTYHGYWYFEKESVWAGLPILMLIVAPTNMIFLNWYPFKSLLWKQLRYFFYWELFLLTYELITLLPEPWGYFHYGWWNLSISAIVNPIILYILLVYYKKFIN